MSLDVQTSGRGRDLVLLHGWGCGAGVWDETARTLADHFRVHAVSLPGYGGSPTCSPYSVDRIAELLAQQFPAACLACGWSLGAQVALAWAHAKPGQVERIALIAATPCFRRKDDWLPGVETTVLEAFVAALDADPPAAVRRFAALQALGDEHERALATRLKAAICVPSSGSALAEGLELLSTTDLRDRLGRIRQPVLLVHGDRDRVTPLGASEYLSRTLPGARLTVMRGTAHAPFLSKPLECAKLLREFFDER